MSPWLLLDRNAKYGGTAVAQGKRAQRAVGRGFNPVPPGWGLLGKGSGCGVAVGTPGELGPVGRPALCLPWAFVPRLRPGIN